MPLFSPVQSSHQLRQHDTLRRAYSHNDGANVSPNAGRRGGKGCPMTPGRARRVAPLLASMKSRFLQPFEHMVLRVLCTELRGECPGVEEWP